MKKISFLSLLSTICFSSFAQVQDVIVTNPVPASGISVNKQSQRQANLTVYRTFYLPKWSTFDLRGGKDSAAAVMFNTAIGRMGVYRGANTWDTIAYTRDLINYAKLPDGLVSIGGITLDGNNVIIVAPVKWRINSIEYQKLTNTVISITPATASFKRIDLIYATTAGTILKIQGNESAGIAVEPTLPANSIRVSPVYITGATITPPAPDLSGYAPISYVNNLDVQNVKLNPSISQSGNINISGNITAKSLHQKIVFVDSYSDSFTGFASSGYNLGSAIYKALADNNFKNVKLILTQKTYFPITNNVVMPYYENVTFEGAGMGNYVNGMQELQKGTIILGGLRIRNDSPNITVKDFSLDGGKFTTDTYYGGSDIEGLYFSYTLADQPSTWGYNFRAENINVLTRSPTGLVHAFIVERCNGVYLDNISSWGSFHGLVIKSKNVFVGTAYSYGNAGENLIIKSGEITTLVDNVHISNFIADKLPLGITSSYVAVPSALYGIMFDGQGTLTRVHIDKADITSATNGLAFIPQLGHIIGDFNINNLQLNLCTTGILRNGAGILANTNIGYYRANSLSGAVYASVTGNVGDNAVKINSMTATSFMSPMPTGFFLRSNSKLEVNTLDASLITNLFDISGNSTLLVNNYSSKNITNIYATGSDPIIYPLEAKQNKVTLTTTGSGAATFNGTTGALNIPTASTTTPSFQSTTDVSPITTNAITIQRSEAALNLISTTGGKTFTFNSSSLGDLRIYDGVTERMTIGNTGNVGIGTTSPQAKLDVNGSARASANDGNPNTLVRNSDLSNSVTTNTSQNITGAKTFDGNFTLNSGELLRNGLGLRLNNAGNTFYSDLGVNTLTANRTLEVPDASGTIARVEDLSNYVNTSITQTGLGGAKTWTGYHNFNSGAAASGFTINSANDLYFNSGSFNSRFSVGTLTANRLITIPDKGGVLSTNAWSQEDRTNTTGVADANSLVFSNFAGTKWIDNNGNTNFPNTSGILNQADPLFGTAITAKYRTQEFTTGGGGLNARFWKRTENNGTWGNWMEIPFLEKNNTWVGTQNVTNTTNSGSTTTGAITTAGGIGVVGNTYTGGFTSLGDNNVGLKAKVLTGTTAASQGASVSVAHGVTPGKIVSVTGVIRYSTNATVPINGSQPSFQSFTATDATNITVTNASANSSGLLSVPFELIVWYRP